MFSPHLARNMEKISWGLLNWADDWAPGLLWVLVLVGLAEEPYDLRERLELPPAAPLDLTALARRHGAALIMDPDKAVQHVRRLYAAYQGHVQIRISPKPCGEHPYLRALVKEGQKNPQEISWEVANKGEILALVKAGFRHWCEVVWTKPVFTDEEAQLMCKLGIGYVVVSTKQSVERLAAHYPGAKILVRLYVDAGGGYTHNFSKKFGVTLQELPSILRLARRHGLDVVGFSFHAGSGMRDPAGKLHGIQMSRAAFVIAENHGFSPWVCNLGGGYDSDKVNSPFDIEAFCAPIVEEIIAWKKQVPGLVLFNEPGRYIAECGFCVAEVVDVFVRGGVQQAYMRDGIYGFFDLVLNEGLKYFVEVVECGEERFCHRTKKLSTKFAGDSCDSVDTVEPENPLLPPLHSGGVVIFHNMGAYCIASRVHAVSSRIARLVMQLFGLSHTGFMARKANPVVWRKKGQAVIGSAWVE